MNNWVDLDSSRIVQYKKNSYGKVTISGIVKSGSGNIVFVLPSGYRPVATRHFIVVSSDGFCDCAVVSNGNVQLSSYSSAWVSLELSFYIN